MCLCDFENRRVARISLFNRRFARLGGDHAYSFGTQQKRWAGKIYMPRECPSLCLVSAPVSGVIPTAWSGRTCGHVVHETIRMPLLNHCVQTIYGILFV
jgi:hypothetical protein